MSTTKLPASPGRSWSELQSSWDSLRSLFPLEALELGEGSVGPGTIAPETLTGDLLVKGTVTGDRVAAGTITGSLIEAGTIDAGHLNVDKLSAIAADLGTVTAGSLEAVTLKGSTIEGGTIKGTTVEGTTVKGGTIEGTTVKGSTIEGATVSGGTITGTIITGGTVRTSATNPKVIMDSAGLTFYDAAANAKIHLDTATGIAFVVAVLSSEDGSEIPTKHLAGQITETQIEEEAIATPLLAANAVTAAKIAVEKLSALSADLGTITAGTITGATFRTSASNPKVQMDSSGISSINSSGEVVVQLEKAGLYMRAGTTSTPGNELRLRWLEGSEDRKVAQIYGWANSSTATGAIFSTETWGAETYAGIRLDAFATAASTTVRAQVGSTFKTILTGASESDFPQLSSTAKRVLTMSKDVTLMGTSEVSEFAQLTELAKRTIDLKGGNVTLRGTGDISQFLQLPEALKRQVIRGTVSAAGAKEEGEGFTVSKTGTGVYKVVLSVELASTGVAVAMPTTLNRMFRNSARSKKEFTFSAVDKGELAADTGFNFIIIG